MKKMLSILLSLAMLCTLLAAMPASAEEQKTLTVAWTQHPVVSSYGDWSETPFIKAWQEQTGVKLDMIQPADYSVYFASGNYADIIYYDNWDNYPGGASKAIEDGIIIPLEDKIEEYAPDYWAVLNSNEKWLKQCTTPDGHIYGFNFIRSDRSLLTVNGLVIRTDWLDELGLEMPETADDLYDVLVAFRDQKGATVPMSFKSWWLSVALEQGAFSSAFGLPRASYYQVDGKVHYGYAEENYKGLMEYFHKLYEEKLFDRSFLTLDDATTHSNMLNGISGASMLAGGGGIGVLLTSAENSGDTTFNLGGVPSLVANKGDRAMAGNYIGDIPGNAVVISTGCKDVETAMKFLNWGYTEAGNTLMNFGIEGKSFTMVDGNETYTDLITHNPDGLTMQQALSQYALSWDGGPFVQSPKYIEQYWGRPQQQQALKAWTDNDAEYYAMPRIAVPSELSDEYSAIYSEVNTFVQEQTVAFITGERSLDEFDSYLDTLKQLNIDRMIEIYQIALDEFNAR